LKLTKKHLGIFDTYEGKKSSLENVGTLKEKELFQNGEFEKITELVQTEYKIKKNELSESEIQNHKSKLNVIFDNNWNKKSLKYLSKKYCEPKKEQSTFDSIMSMLWAMFG
jgi:cobyrinic acid a,c-diamide synthase